MKFGAVEEKDWRSCQAMVEEAELVRRHAERLVDVLKAVFSQGYQQANQGITFDGQDYELQAIKTPGCSGRLRLTWDIASGHLVGRYLVERHQGDSFGVQQWIPVWAVTVTPGRSAGFDCMYAYGDDIAAGFDLGGYSPYVGGNPDQKVGFTVGMSMAYAINRQDSIAEE